MARFGIFSGTPSNSPYLCSTTDQQDVLGTGGQVEYFTAKQALLYGDLVYVDPVSVSVDKNLESGLYCRTQVGIVVGGPITDFKAIDDSNNMIGVQVAAAGQMVLVLTYGIGFAIVDAANIQIGQPLTPGRTTAGRVRGDMNVSYAVSSAGLAINAGGALIAKAVSPTQTVVAGVPGTSTAANLAMAALAGTVTNLKFNVFALYVGANGTTVTSAMGTEAATLAGVVWPVGDPTKVLLGYIIINPTGAGNFIGATTALDDATVVPNAVYVNVVGTRITILTALAAGGAAASSIKVRVG